jgi:hypothetical protein
MGLGFGDLTGNTGNDDVSAGTDVDSLRGIDVLSPVLMSAGDDMSWSSDTPAQITSNQDDYGLADAVVHRLSSDAARVITGFAAPYNRRKILIINVGSFNITINHDDGNSAPANRVLSGTGANVTLQPNHCVVLWYDFASTRWRIYA